MTMDQSRMDGALVLHIPAFVDRMLTALDRWELAEGQDLVVLRNSEHLVESRPQGIPGIIFGGVIG